MPRPFVPRRRLPPDGPPFEPEAENVAAVGVSPSASPQKAERTVRPVMQVLDLLGRRWTLRLIWEVGLGEAGFVDLQHRSGTSPTVLSKRLSELTAAGVLERHESGYGLTEQGRELRQVLLQLNDWAEKWSSPPDMRG